MFVERQFFNSKTNPIAEKGELGKMFNRLSRLFPGVTGGVTAIVLLGAPAMNPGSLRAAAPELRIAAAADLQPLLPAVLREFQTETGIHAEATYQASAVLETQIENGAPFDLFLSADLGYPKRLIEQRLADTRGVGRGSEHEPGSDAPDRGQSGVSGRGRRMVDGESAPLPYARGALVLWTRNDSRWRTPSLAILKDPMLQRLSIANPDRAPYGRAAVALFQSLGLMQSLTAKLVTGENVAQAAQFAASGNADAGLISLSAAMSAPLRSAGSYFVIPADLYPAIDQGAAIVSASPQHQSAERFLNFLLSEPAKKLLSAGGLTPTG